VSGNQRISRRRFLECSALLGAGAVMTAGPVGCAMRGTAAKTAARDVAYLPHLAVAKGGEPGANCLAAVAALGGFARFVGPGQRVVIKPNPVGTSQPDQAINTHPEMVGAVTRACLQAGAREVVVLSFDSLQNMEANGTAAAVRDAGGTLKALNGREEFREVLAPRGRILGRELVAIDVLDSDVFINMPIAKHHAGSEVTFAMKNLMGINFDRMRFHRTDLQQCIAELAAVVRHDLVILDANHVLLSNGPIGPGEVATPGEVVASVDPVAIDAFACRYLNRRPETIGHIRSAHELGVGEIDLARLRIQEVAV
jgi:uncharacterized protein (DUF362 family)